MLVIEKPLAFIREGGQLFGLKFSSSSLVTTGSNSENFQQLLEKLERDSTSCQQRPSFKIAAQICSDTRDAWSEIWENWLWLNDKSLAHFQSVLPIFEKAKAAAEALLETVPNSSIREKSYGDHLLRNITMRLDMARVLLDDKIPVTERKQLIIGMLDKVSERTASR